MNAFFRKFCSLGAIPMYIVPHNLQNLSLLFYKNGVFQFLTIHTAMLIVSQDN